MGLAERHKIPYKPRLMFLPFHARTQRFAIEVANRPAGKTVACVNDIIRRAVISPKDNYRAAYIAPFRSQAKDVAWEYVKRYSKSLWGSNAPNEGDLYIRLFNEARIIMLAAQMAAVHNATMTFARRLAHVDNIPQQDSAERAFNKLARTFAAQVEALKRYRSGGEQTVQVEHVTVNEGGQAIVGNVSHGGRGSSEKKEPSS